MPESSSANPVTAKQTQQALDDQSDLGGQRVRNKPRFADPPVTPIPAQSFVANPDELPA
jgi:hypothetical protein